MDSSPSAHSPDVRESRPAFRKPANEVSRRNYRRHSPSSSRSPTPPSPGGWKRGRSPSRVSQDDGGSKRGRRLDSEIEMGRGDTGRSRKGADAGSYDYRSHSRDRYARSEDYDHSYNRRHSSYHDRSYHSSVGRDSRARADYYRYNDVKYSTRSPERAVRERGNDEGRHRRKESRGSEKDRDREDKGDVWDRYRSKDREACSGLDKSGGKRRDEGSHVEVERSRYGKKIDNGVSHRDADDDEGRDWDAEKVDGKEKHKSKLDTEKLREKESRRREREEGKEKEREKDEDDHHRNRDSRHNSRDEKHRKKAVHASDIRNDDGHEGAGEHSKERTQHGQDGSKKEDKDRKHSSEPTNLNRSSSEMPLESQDATTAGTHGPAVAALGHNDESRKLVSTVDEKFAKSTKWGPEAEALDTATASSDPEVATMAAMKAAALVNINLGGIKSVDEKKKMLWRSKNQESAAVSGTNRWDTVQFADQERREKFNKLMGVKGEAVADVPQSGDNVSGLFTTEKQEELQQDLEKQFTAGLRRRDGRTVGLGL